MAETSEAERRLTEMLRESKQDISRQAAELASTKKEVEMLRQQVADNSALLHELHAVKAEMKNMAAKISEQNDLLRTIAQAHGERLGALEKVAAQAEHHVEGLKALRDEARKAKEETDRRLNEVEKAVLTIARNEKNVDDLNKRVDRLEKEPGDRWKSMTAQIIGLVVAAVVGAVIVMVTG